MLVFPPDRLARWGRLLLAISYSSERRLGSAKKLLSLDLALEQLEQFEHLFGI